MTAGVWEQDEIDILNDLEHRVHSLEIATSSILHDEANVINGGAVAELPDHIVAESIIADALYAGTIQAWLITAEHIATNSLTADVIDVQDLAASTAFIEELVASTAFITDLVSSTAFITELTASTAFISNLTASAAFIDGLVANTAFISELEAELITVTNLEAMWADVTVLTGGTIIGGSFITPATTGQRVEVIPAGIKGYNGAGTKTFDLLSSSGVFFQADPTSIIPGGALSNAQLGGGNLIPNSSIEQGQQPGDATDRRGEGWEQYGGGAGTGPSNTRAFDGANSYKLISNGTVLYFGRRDVGLNRIPVKGGMTYTISAWIFSESAGQSASVFAASYSGVANGYSGNLLFDHGGGVNVNGVPTANASKALVQNGWTRVVWTLTVPAGATHLGFLLNMSPAANGATFYVDAVQLEQGDAVTGYSPKGDEILYSSLRSVFIGAAEIKATNLDVASVQAQHIRVVSGSTNILQNAEFSYYPGAAGTGVVQTTGPGYWQNYDNGGTAATPGYSKVTNGGPAGKHSWRLQVTNNVTSQKGFMCTRPFLAVANSKFVMSFYWKGNSPPQINGNGGWSYQWLDPDTGAVIAGATAAASPTAASTTVWKRYACRLTMDATGGRVSYNPGGGATAGWDYMYVMPSTLNFSGAGGNAIDVQFALPQLEGGEILTAHSAAPSEILPGTVGPTQITPNSITTNELDVVQVRANILVADMVDTIHLKAGSVKADKISVGFGGANLLTNPSFEFSAAGNAAQQFDGWVIASGGVNWATDNDPRYGGRSARCGVSSAQNSYIYQDVVVKKGNYIVSCWMKWSGLTSAGAALNVDVPSGTAVAVRTNAAELVAQGVSAAPGGDTKDVLINGPANSDWVRVWTSVQVTSATATLRVYLQYGYVSTPASGTVWFDGVQVEEGEHPTAFTNFGPDQLNGTQIGPGVVKTVHLEANSITADKINFTIAGNNLLANSGWRLGNAGWTFYNLGGSGGSWLATTAGGPISNGPYLQVSSGATPGSRLGVYQTISNIRSGAKYSASAYAWSPTSKNLTIWIDWYGSSGLISQVSRTFATIASWVRYSTDALGAFTAPAGATTGVVYVWYDNPNASTTNYIGNIQVEEGERTTPWKQYINPTVIDGDSVTAGLIRTAATGTRIEINGLATNNYIKSFVGTDEILSIDGSGLRFASPAQYAARGGSAGGGVLSEILWLDSSNVSMSALSGGMADPGASDANWARLSARGTSASGRGGATAAILASETAGIYQNFVVAEARPGTDFQVYAQSNGIRKSIINYQGKSHFLQLDDRKQIIFHGPFLWQHGAMASFTGYSRTINHGWGGSGYIMASIHEWSSPPYGAVGWSYRINSSTQFELRMHNFAGAAIAADMLWWYVESTNGATII